MKYKIPFIITAFLLFWTVIIILAMLFSCASNGYNIVTGSSECAKRGYDNFFYVDTLYHYGDCDRFQTQQEAQTAHDKAMSHCLYVDLELDEDLLETHPSFKDLYAFARYECTAMLGMDLDYNGIACEYFNYSISKNIK